MANGGDCAGSAGGIDFHARGPSDYGVARDDHRRGPHAGAACAGMARTAGEWMPLARPAASLPTSASSSVTVVCDGRHSNITESSSFVAVGWGRGVYDGTESTTSPAQCSQDGAGVL